MKSLQERGLYGFELIISDDHAGLKAVRKTVFSSVPWQRCQFHLQQNAQSYIPRDAMKVEVAADIRGNFYTPPLKEAERLLGSTTKKYEKSEPRPSSWLDGNIREGLTVFNLSTVQRRKLRTSNMLERLNEEVRRRIKVISSFPNKESALRLMSFVLMEKGDDWGEGNRYVIFSCWETEGRRIYRTNVALSITMGKLQKK